MEVKLGVMCFAQDIFPFFPNVFETKAGAKLRKKSEK